MPKARVLNASLGGVNGKTLLAVLLAFLAVTAFYQIAGTVKWEIGNLFAIPAYDDMFDHARMYRALGSGKQFFSYLISAHNEHRIFTTRIVSYLDDMFFHGREYTQIAVTNLLQIVSAGIAWRIMVRYDNDENPLHKIVLFAIVLLLFINPNLLYTLIYPFQVQHAIMAVLCVGSAAVVANASALPEMSAYGSRRLIASLLLLAFVATFTLGNAPVILLAAAAMSVILRWRLWIIATLSLLAVGHTAFVLLTTTSTGAQSYNLLSILRFALFYWGGPFIRFDAWPAGYVTWGASTRLAELCGAVVLAVGAGFGVARFFRRGLGGPAAAFGLTVLVIVIVTGLAAGHARAQFGLLEGASKKYASFAALGWLGVLAVAIGLLQDTWIGRPLRKQAMLLSVHEKLT